MTGLLSLLSWLFSPWVYADPSFQEFPQARYWVACIFLCSTWGFGWMKYHCIYRKPGIKLLTIILITTAIGLVISPILYLSGKIQPPADIPYYGVYLLVYQIVGIYWLAVSWKMRRINKKLQALSCSSVNES